MPIRIKPEHDLGPCVLTLESIQRIAELVERDCPWALYSANDQVCEIYDETKESFLSTISKRETLDSFTAYAETVEPDKNVKIEFNEDKAKVTCEAQPEHEHWFEHFLIDLKKCILPPSFRQVVVHKYGKGEFHLSLPFVFIPFSTRSIISTPYTRI